MDAAAIEPVRDFCSQDFIAAQVLDEERRNGNGSALLVDQAPQCVCELAVHGCCAMGLMFFIGVDWVSVAGVFRNTHGGLVDLRRKRKR